MDECGLRVESVRMHGLVIPSVSEEWTCLWLWEREKVSGAEREERKRGRERREGGGREREGRRRERAREQREGKRGEGRREVSDGKGVVLHVHVHDGGSCTYVHMFVCN